MNYESKQVAELSDVLQLIKGFPTSRTQDQGEIPVMSIAVLRNGELPRLFTDSDQLMDVTASMAEVGDVLVAVEGGTVGESLVVKVGMIGFVPSQQVMTLRVLRHGPLDPWYLGAWLRSEQGRANLSRLVKGSGIQRIAHRDLLTLEIAFPPMPEQLRIGQLYRIFDEAIDAHESVVSDIKKLMTIEIDAAITPLFAAKTKDGGAR